MTMTPDDLEHFYEGALTAGAILFGFIGTFLSFRIQREANYYRRPVLDFNIKKPEGRAKDVFVNRSRFPLSLLLLLLGALPSMLCGVFLPLSGLAHWFMVCPAAILAGTVATLVLIAAYFFAEMFHYGMLRKNPKEWRGERWIAFCGISLALILAAVTYLSLRD